MKKNIVSALSREGWMAPVIGMAVVSASIAGAGAAENAAVGKSPTVAATTAPAEGALTVQEWITRIKQEVEAEKLQPRDEEFEKILFGCAAITSRATAEPSSVESLAGLNEAFECARTFWNERGKALLEKWLAGEKLTAEERKYEPIIKCLWMAHGCRARHAGMYKGMSRPLVDIALTDKKIIDDTLKYTQRLDKEISPSVFRKGYRGEKLTPEDIDILRQRRILFSLVGGERDDPHLPIFLKLHPQYTDTNDRNEIEGDGRLPMRIVGSSIEDIPLYRLDAVLKRPSYSDIADYRYQMTYALRPEAVLQYLEEMTAFYVEKNEKGAEVARYNPQYGKQLMEKGAGEVVGFRSLLQGKPLLVFNQDPIDYSYNICELTEILHQAYRNQVDVMFVSRFFHEPTLGPAKHLDFYSPDLTRNTRMSPSMPFMLAGRAYNIAEKARMLKGRLIWDAASTFPCYLDSMGSLFTDRMVFTGGVNTYALMDKNGLIVDYGAEMISPALFLNEIERAFTEWIGADGVWTGKPFSSMMRSWRRSECREIPRIILLNGNIISTDVSTGNMTVDVRIRGEKQKEETRRVEVSTTPMSRIQISDKIVPDINRLVVGDKVTIFAWFDSVFGDDAKVKAVSGDPMMHSPGEVMEVASGKSGAGAKLIRWHFQPIYASIFEPASLTGVSRVTASWIVGGEGSAPSDFITPTTIKHHVWLYGHVKSVDLAKRTMVVEQSLLEPEKMIGYQAWKKDKDRMLIDNNEGKFTVEKRLKVLDSWVEKQKADGPQQYTFMLDDATVVTVNGEFGSGIADVHRGDFVSVLWPLDQINAVQPRPDMVRISKPIGK